jgi:CubicO group peptidase (beta-lactamase class C family)
MNRKTFLPAFLLLLVTTVHPQTNHSKKLDSLFTFYQKHNHFNGSVLVSKKGKILLKRGYGFQNVELNVKNNPEGIFQTYSITKTFTATVILKLVEEKKISLTDKFSKFYPGFPKGDSISIENLLTHTSGLYEYTHGNNMPDHSEKSFVAFMKSKPLDFPPGTDSRYSNTGYYFLGFIIEKVTGMRYEQAVAKYIFNPLRMSQSGFAFKNLRSKNKAIGYETFTSKVKKPAEVINGPFSVGGIYSTVGDLYKYYNGLKAYKVLKKETLEKAYTHYKGGFGYGWMVIPIFNKTTVGHSGAYFGWRSNFVQIPEDDICIILLANCENDLNYIAGGVMKVMYDKPYKIPVAIRLKPEVLQEYKGTYQVNNDLVIYVSIEDGKLIAQPKQQPKNILYPEKVNLFYVEELDGYIRFERNKRDQIDTLKFTMQGQEMKAFRINPSWGIIGSATDNGWDGLNIELTETGKAGIWVINNVPLKDGEIKFRFNNDWTINLGDNNSGGLISYGDNIKVESGTYDITLDLSDEEIPRYKIVKKK